MTDQKQESPRDQVNTVEGGITDPISPQEYVNSQSMAFYNEVMKYSNPQFGIEYLMNVCRQLAQKDLELQQREREFWAYQQSITRKYVPYVRRGRGRGRGGRGGGRGRRGRGRNPTSDTQNIHDTHMSNVQTE